MFMFNMSQLINQFLFSYQGGVLRSLSDIDDLASTFTKVSSLAIKYFYLETLCSVLVLLFRNCYNSQLLKVVKEVCYVRV